MMELRDQNGMLKAALTDNALAVLFDTNLSGEWKTKQFQDNTERTCFIINTEAKVRHPALGVVYIWEGDYLVRPIE